MNEQTTQIKQTLSEATEKYESLKSDAFRTIRQIIDGCMGSRWTVCYLSDTRLSIGFFTSPTLQKTEHRFDIFIGYDMLDEGSWMFTTNIPSMGGFTLGDKNNERFLFYQGISKLLSSDETIAKLEKECKEFVDNTMELRSIIADLRYQLHEITKKEEREANKTKMEAVRQKQKAFIQNNMNKTGRYILCHRTYNTEDMVIYKGENYSIVDSEKTYPSNKLDNNHPLSCGYRLIPISRAKFNI